MYKELLIDAHSNAHYNVFNMILNLGYSYADAVVQPTGVRMYSRVLKQMKESVKLRNYIVTVHAVEEMDDDSFSIFDVEHCILHGEINERQKELKSAEWKYLVMGLTFQHRGICVVAKISITGKMVIITVYAL